MAYSVDCIGSNYNASSISEHYGSPTKILRIAQRPGNQLKNLCLKSSLTCLGISYQGFYYPTSYRFTNRYVVEPVLQA